MKKALLVTAILLWIISIPVIFICVDKYIESKDNRLKWEFSNAISEFFNGKEYIDIVYSGRKVSYEKINIPNKPKPTNSQNEESKRVLGNIDQKILEEWHENYGDLYKLYRIKNSSSEWTVPYEEEDGKVYFKLNLQIRLK